MFLDEYIPPGSLIIGFHYILYPECAWPGAHWPGETLTFSFLQGCRQGRLPKPETQVTFKTPVEPVYSAKKYYFPIYKYVLPCFL